MTTDIKSQQLSFEVFPPRNQAQHIQLIKTVEALTKFSPDYFSVTHGATGKTLQGTFETVEEISTLGFNVAPHITTKIETFEKLKELLLRYKELKIRRAVVIKGDATEPHADFNTSNELIKAIHTIAPEWKLAVACYPEFHPLGTVANDLIALRKKQEVGATYAITQFFFSFDSYLHFLELLEKENINLPIVVGVLPIVQFNAMRSFADKCGADVPRWLIKQMEYYEHDPASQRALGIHLITSLMQNIIALKDTFHGFHIYTLNQTDLCSVILQNLGYGKVLSNNSTR
ncbi:MAG: methylenetetrahydrofolate reductase [Methylacidiphilales bacterium]|nr:methylenetetrahydrofolate reductase [Candidatus Methylacidiphilales bacterium]